MGDATITESQDGSVLKAKVGDALEVRLPEVPTTGYRWEVVTLPLWLTVVHSHLTLEDPSVGGGGTRSLRLRVDGPGEGAVVLELRPVWDEAPLQRWCSTLRVDPVGSPRTPAPGCRPDT